LTEGFAGCLEALGEYGLLLGELGVLLFGCRELLFEHADMIVQTKTPDQRADAEEQRCSESNQQRV
jgi:hypothetical protein